eukprot:3939356-Pyramimonas_sp.AAC.1
MARTALRLHFAAPPQTHAQGLRPCHPEVSNSDGFEPDFAAVVGPSPLAPVEEAGHGWRET